MNDRETMDELESISEQMDVHVSRSNKRGAKRGAARRIGLRFTKFKRLLASMRAHATQKRKSK